MLVFDWNKFFLIFNSNGKNFKMSSAKRENKIIENYCINKRKPFMIYIILGHTIENLVFLEITKNYILKNINR